MSSTHSEVERARALWEKAWPGTPWDSLSERDHATIIAAMRGEGAL